MHAHSTESFLFMILLPLGTIQDKLCLCSPLLSPFGKPRNRKLPLLLSKAAAGAEGWYSWRRKRLRSFLLFSPPKTSSPLTVSVTNVSEKPSYIYARTAVCAGQHSPPARSRPFIKDETYRYIFLVDCLCPLEPSACPPT